MPLQAHTNAWEHALYLKRHFSWEKRSCNFHVTARHAEVHHQLGPGGVPEEERDPLPTQILWVQLHGVLQGTEGMRPTGPLTGLLIARCFGLLIGYLVATTHRMITVCRLVTLQVRAQTSTEEGGKLQSHQLRRQSLLGSQGL